MTQRLFDRYIMVDWSAAATPKTGTDSIWIGVLTIDGNEQAEIFCLNPPTRLAARQDLVSLLGETTPQTNRALVGFDFALGYPSGTAAALGLGPPAEPAWQRMHTYLSEWVSETADNSNTRFALAAQMNQILSGGPHPFWGVPANKRSPYLQPKKGVFSDHHALSEQRLAERWIKSRFKASPKSVWQLLGAGAVGSQSLLGIPTLTYFRQVVEQTQIWPFETGFQALTETRLHQTRCVFAEVYPSTLNWVQNPDEVRDAAQVRSLCEQFYALDKQGQLGAAFGPPDSLERGKIAQIEGEEGWILTKNV